MYHNELEALRKSGRYRERRVYPDTLKDFASNDYLGLASSKKTLKKTLKKIEKLHTFAPKASMLVNGYHQVHKDFERDLALINNFDDAILVGSGFLANITLIESLVRKNDTLFIDEEFHASGFLASRLVIDNVVIFKHNSLHDLKEKYEKATFNRAIICVEGVYSMSGDVLSREIIDFALEQESLLILDEAHSCGVLGKTLLGILEYYRIKERKNIIKMGTLGKAYGSYGAYILASKEVIDFLINRGKGIIYTTALSLFDTVLGHQHLKYIQKNHKTIHRNLATRRELAYDMLGKKIESQILTINIKNNEKLKEVDTILKNNHFLVGAIRRPTVKSPILRVILRDGDNLEDTKKLLYILKEIC